MCIKIYSMHCFLLYLDDFMHAFKKRRGLDIQDCYFGEGMESNSNGEKKKREGKTKYSSKTMCSHS